MKETVVANKGLVWGLGALMGFWVPSIGLSQNGNLGANGATLSVTQTGGSLNLSGGGTLATTQTGGSNSNGGGLSNNSGGSLDLSGGNLTTTSGKALNPNGEGHSNTSGGTGDGGGLSTNSGGTLQLQGGTLDGGTIGSRHVRRKGSTGSNGDGGGLSNNPGGTLDLQGGSLSNGVTEGSSLNGGTLKMGGAPKTRKKSKTTLSTNGIKTKAPGLADEQKAVVTGSNGEEINTDKYGRVKTNYPWIGNGTGKSKGKSKNFSTANSPKTKITKTLPSMKQAGSSSASVTAPSKNPFGAAPRQGFVGKGDGNNPPSH